MKSSAQSITRVFETVSLGSPDRAVGFVLWRVIHLYQREIDRLLAPLDLTHLQFTTLMLVAWLGKDGRPATQIEVARFGDIHPMQVSTILKALEAKRMVEREPAASGRSAKTVAVTRHGLATLERAFPLGIELQRRLFGEEGRPGGSLLAALLRVERRAASAHGDGLSASENV